MLDWIDKFSSLVEGWRGDGREEGRRPQQTGVSLTGGRVQPRPTNLLLLLRLSAGEAELVGWGLVGRGGEEGLRLVERGGAGVVRGDGVGGVRVKEDRNRTTR